HDRPLNIASCPSQRPRTRTSELEVSFMKTSITWLHLSDLHVRPEENWDADRVREALVRDLKTMEQKHQLQPDFVFFSGDLAFGETKSRAGEVITSQFQQGQKFLDTVRTAFGGEVPIENVFVVPGNHDVNGQNVDPFSQSGLAA